MRLTNLVFAAVFLSSVSAIGAEVSLDGTWESCFQPTDALPAADVEWKPIEVPSLAGRVEGKPYLWYRRVFPSPAKSAGERMFLRIGASRFVTTVFLNGREVGGHYGGWEPFEIEITGALRVQGPNQLLTRVQDVTGVIAQDLSAQRPPRGGSLHRPSERFGDGPDRVPLLERRYLAACDDFHPP